MNPRLTEKNIVALLAGSASHCSLFFSSSASLHLPRAALGSVAWSLTSVRDLQEAADSNHTQYAIKLADERRALLLVGVAGFEPTASWSRTKRATICATPRFDLKLSFIRSICRCAMSPLRFPQKHSRTARLERFALLLVFSPQSFACFVRRTRRISSPICATPRSI